MLEDSQGQTTLYEINRKGIELVKCKLLEEAESDSLTEPYEMYWSGYELFIESPEEKSSKGACIFSLDGVL